MRSTDEGCREGGGCLRNEGEVVGSEGGDNGRDTQMREDCVR